MSRHILTQRRDLPGLPVRLEIVVGWDGPLQTFFCQVIDLGEDEEPDRRVLLWLGQRWRAEIVSTRILEALRQWAEMPPWLADTLIDEREADLREIRPMVLRWVEARLRDDGPAE